MQIDVICNLREMASKIKYRTKKLGEKKNQQILFMSVLKTKPVSGVLKKRKKTQSWKKEKGGEMINLWDIYLINSVRALNEVNNLGAVAGLWNSCKMYVTLYYRVQNKSCCYLI